MSRPHDWTTFRSPGHRLVVTTVRTAERLSKAAERLLKTHRIGLAQFNLLAVLMGNPDGLPQSRIGEKFIVSRANITSLVRRTKRLDLCRVDADPRDARIKVVRITPKGRTLLGRLEGPYFREIQRITASFPPSALTALASRLDRLQELI